jgi:hypothetical protein
LILELGLKALTIFARPSSGDTVTLPSTPQVVVAVWDGLRIAAGIPELTFRLPVVATVADTQDQSFRFAERPCAVAELAFG